MQSDATDPLAALAPPAAAPLKYSPPSPAASPIAHLTFDRAGIIQSIDTQGAAFLNETPERLRHQPFARLLEPDAAQNFARFLDHAFSATGRASCELTLASQDFPRLSVQCVGVPGADHTHCHAVLLDITERKRLEAVLQSRLRIVEFSLGHTLDEILTCTLDEAEQLTGSQIGFFHFVEADQRTLSLQTWSTNTLQRMCTAEGKGQHYPAERAGVWADALRERRTVIHNDYAALAHAKGLPPGHAPVTRLMVVPVLRNQLVVALVGVGNKPSNYQPDDVANVAALADLIWDIADAKRQAEALSEREAQYHHLADAGSALIWTAGTDKGCNFFNQPWLNFTGRTLAQEMGNGWTEGIHPEDLGACLRTYESAFDKREPFAMEYRLRHASGEYRWIQDLGTPNHDRRGEFVGYIGHCFDITQRKQAETAIQRREHILAAVGLAAEHFLTAQDWRATVPEVLSQLGQAAEVSRVVIWQSHPDPQGVTLISQRYEWVSHGLPSRTDDPTVQNLPLIAGGFARWHTVLGRGDVIHGLVQEFPACEQPALRHHHILAIAVVPILVAGRWWGFMAFDECRHERAWRPDEIEALQAAARILGEAIHREETEAAVRESERRFHGLLQNVTAVAVQGYAADGTVQYWNHASELLYGYTAAEAIGRNLVDLIIPPAMRPAVSAAVHQMATSGQAIPAAELTLIRKDGSPVTVFSSHAVVQIPGRAPELFCIDVDLTERQRMEEAHARLATVIEQAHDSVVVTDPQGTIQYANPAFERSSGYTAAEAVGNNPRLLKSGRQTAEFYEKMWATLKRGEVWSGHLINRRKDGSIYEEEAIISPIFDGARNIVSYMAIKRDVTREVQLEERLRQAQKMEAVGQLAGGVAHDFNNILCAMIMQLELLGTTPNLSADMVAGLQDIRAGADRAAHLTRQLLLFGRRQVMQSRELDLNEVVNNLGKMLRRLIPEDITLRLELAHALPPLRADAGMIEQVIMNLVINARQAISHAGIIALQTGTKIADADCLRRNPDILPGPYVSLSISDNGSGIAPQVLPHIFEPFFTTKETGQGTGLGLATVFGIVKQHHGWIEVKSEPGRGTTFRVYLPAITQPSAPQAIPAAPPKPRGGTETILITEDELALRTGVGALLKHCGYRVLTAADGPEALRIWDLHRAHIALLLTDIIMPGGISGLQLAQRFQAGEPRLKVIFMSGYSAEVAGREAKLTPRQRLLQKPFSPDQLLGLIRECLDTPAPV